VQGIEIGNAVDAEDHGLAINDELRVPVLQRALDDPGKTAGPVMAVAGEQVHASAIAGHDQPVAVVLDFMEPMGGRRNDVSGDREAGLKQRASHGRNICTRAGIANRPFIAARF
jgi:hypothetical protein